MGEVLADGSVEVGVGGWGEDDVVEAAAGVDGQADGEFGSGEVALRRPAIEFVLDAGEVAVFDPFVALLLAFEGVAGALGWFGFFGYCFAGFC